MRFKRGDRLIDIESGATFAFREYYDFITWEGIVEWDCTVQPYITRDIVHRKSWNLWFERGRHVLSEVARNRNTDV